MARDRSLDEFVDGDGRGANDDGDTGSGAPPEPAVSTARFDPDGAACGSCGASVQRRWRDDGALVCGDCKEW